MAEHTQKWERTIISNLQWSTILSTQVSMPPVWLRPFFFKYTLYSANFKPSRLLPPTGKSCLSVHVGKEQHRTNDTILFTPETHWSKSKLAILLQDMLNLISKWKGLHLAPFENKITLDVFWVVNKKQIVVQCNSCRSWSRNKRGWHDLKVVATIYGLPSR